MDPPRKKLVRLAHDFEMLEGIATELDHRLRAGNVSISSEKRGTLLALWYQSNLERRDVNEDDIQAWIELAKD